MLISFILSVIACNINLSFTLLNITDVENLMTSKSYSLVLYILCFMQLKKKNFIRVRSANPVGHTSDFPTFKGL